MKKTLKNIRKRRRNRSTQEKFEMQLFNSKAAKEMKRAVTKATQMKNQIDYSTVLTTSSGRGKSKLLLSIS